MNPKVFKSILLLNLCLIEMHQWIFCFHLQDVVFIDFNSERIETFPSEIGEDYDHSGSGQEPYNEMLPVILQNDQKFQFLPPQGLNGLQLQLVELPNEEAFHKCIFTQIQTLASLPTETFWAETFFSKSCYYLTVVTTDFSPMFCDDGFKVRISSATRYNSSNCFAKKLDCGKEAGCQGQGHDLCQNKGTCVAIETNRSVCLCLPGFTGRFCEHMIDECISGPCLNGGTCHDLIGGFKCVCKLEFHGTRCERVPDSCLLNPCLNNGTCINTNNAFSCICTSGYSGKLCENETVKCSRKHYCTNSGRCYTDERGFHSCHCLPEFTGRNCSVHMFACGWNECYEEGTWKCESNPDVNDGQNRCLCLPGFQGDLCDEDVDECLYSAQSICGEHGRCVNLRPGFTCDCSSGFTGKFCEIDIDECVSNPCMPDRGLCVDGPGSFSCYCINGFEGERCEIESNECQSSPCQNHSTCIDLVAGYQCVCPVGFTGRNCDVDIDDCVGHPCGSRGSCIDQVDGFICQCLPGYVGVLCDVDMDECASQPCVNNGTCLNLLNRFECHCPFPYRGVACHYLPCDESPCHNLATCHNVLDEEDENGFRCECASGYTGIQCLTNLDECQSNPCENGICIDQLDGFLCLCPAGLAGKFCHLPVNRCENVFCENGGECEDLEGENFVCRCRPGWDGLYCEREANECHIYEPCRNGATCIDKFRSYDCVCLPGFRGRNCSVEIDECGSNPCENNGKCEDLTNHYRCLCPPLFTGVHCESTFDPCVAYDHDDVVDGDVCRNGAACLVNDVGEVSCQCTIGYQGHRCEENVNECESDPCMNGGKCRDGVAGYECICTDMFEGEHCELEITQPCDKKPCSNHATCYNLLGHQAFFCLCPEGFEGNICDMDINECNDWLACLNGGKCYNFYGGYLCECPSGFKGKKCEIDIDECLSSPCHNQGTCQNHQGYFTCNCDDYHEGEFCEKSILCSSHPCLNNGTCVEEDEDFICTCPLEWSGRFCEVSMSFLSCEDMICENNSTCEVELDGNVVCRCLEGYQGELCEIDLNQCRTSNPCLNDGKCVYQDGETTCQCSDQFSGQFCEVKEQVLYCSSNPCENNGHCVEGERTFKCFCRPGFHGHTCAIVRNPCWSDPCENGGRCSIDADGGEFRCLCDFPFYGATCQHVDEAVEESSTSGDLLTSDYSTSGFSPFDFAASGGGGGGGEVTSYRSGWYTTVYLLPEPTLPPLDYEMTTHLYTSSFPVTSSAQETMTSRDGSGEIDWEEASAFGDGREHFVVIVTPASTSGGDLSPTQSPLTTTILPTTIALTMEPTTIESTENESTTIVPTTTESTTILSTAIALTMETTIESTETVPTTIESTENESTTIAPTTIESTTTVPTTIESKTIVSATMESTEIAPTTIESITIESTEIAPTTIESTENESTTIVPTTTESTTFKSTTIVPSSTPMFTMISPTERTATKITTPMIATETNLNFRTTHYQTITPRIMETIETTIAHPQTSVLTETTYLATVLLPKSTISSTTATTLILAPQTNKPTINQNIRTPHDPTITTNIQTTNTITESQIGVSTALATVSLPKTTVSTTSVIHVPQTKSNKRTKAVDVTTTESSTSTTVTKRSTTITPQGTPHNLASNNSETLLQVSTTDITSNRSESTTTITTSTIENNRKIPDASEKNSDGGEDSERNIETQIPPPDNIRGENEENPTVVAPQEDEWWIASFFDQLDTQNDDCDRGEKCQNGGECVLNFEYGTSYSCRCNDKYQGEKCEERKCDRKCLNGATCILNDYEEDFCLCPNEWTGPSCDTKATAPSSGLYFRGNRTSFLCRTLLKRRHLRSNFQLRWSFSYSEPLETSSQVLAFLGNKESSADDYLIVTFENLHVILRYDLGSGTAVLMSHELDTRDPFHWITVHRSGPEATLTVDGKSVAGNSPGSMTSFDCATTPGGRCEFCLGGFTAMTTSPLLKSIGHPQTFHSFRGCVINTTVTSQTDPQNRHDFLDDIESASGRQVSPCPSTCPPAQETCPSPTGGNPVCVPDDGNDFCGTTAEADNFHIDQPEGDPSFDGTSWLLMATSSLRHRTVTSLELRSDDVTSDSLVLIASDLKFSRDFLALVIKDGHLEMRINLGGGSPTTLAHRDQLLPDVWYKIHLERRGGFSEIRVEDKDKSSSVFNYISSNYTLLDVPNRVWFGSHPKMAILNQSILPRFTTGFKGCMRDLRVNHWRFNRKTNQLSSHQITACDGSPCSFNSCSQHGLCSPQQSNVSCECERSWTGENCQVSVLCHNNNSNCHNNFTCNPLDDVTSACDCHWPFEGRFCDDVISSSEKSTRFTGDSLAIFSIDDLDVSKKTTVSFAFQTKQTSNQAVIFWIGGRESSEEEDYMSASLEYGRLKICMQLGSDDRKFLVSKHKYNDLEWHKVTVKRIKKRLTLFVDGRLEAGLSHLSNSHVPVAGYEELNGASRAVIGCRKNELRKFTSFFIGCIKELKINDVNLHWSISEETKNLVSC